jgi:hypothetical protein
MFERAIKVQTFTTVSAGLLPPLRQTPRWRQGDDAGSVPRKYNRPKNQFVEIFSTFVKKTLLFQNKVVPLRHKFSIKK